MKTSIAAAALLLGHRLTHEMKTHHEDMAMKALRTNDTMHPHEEGVFVNPDNVVVNLDKQLPVGQELDLESMRFSMMNAGMHHKIVDSAVTKLRHIANFQSLDDHHVRVACLIMMQVIARSPLSGLVQKINDIPLDVKINIPETMDRDNLPPVPAISNKQQIMNTGDKERWAAAEAKRARKAARYKEHGL